MSVSNSIPSSRLWRLYMHWAKKAEQCRRNADGYQQHPAGDTWRAMVLAMAKAIDDCSTELAALLQTGEETPVEKLRARIDSMRDEQQDYSERVRAEYGIGCQVEAIPMEQQQPAQSWRDRPPLL